MFIMLDVTPASPQLDTRENLPIILLAGVVLTIHVLELE